MPRQARLDAPGALHHVMGRGIEGISIFRSDEDREDFLARLGSLCEGKALSVHAWALLGNHFHLLIRTGNRGYRRGYGSDRTTRIDEGGFRQALGCAPAEARKRGSLGETVSRIGILVVRKH